MMRDVRDGGERMRGREKEKEREIGLGRQYVCEKLVM